MVFEFPLFYPLFLCSFLNRQTEIVVLLNGLLEESKLKPSETDYPRIESVSGSVQYKGKLVIDLIKYNFAKLVLIDFDHQDGEQILVEG